MAKKSTQRRVQQSILEGFNRMRRFQKARSMYIKQYVGHYYRQEYGTEGDEPINMIYHVIRSLVPNLVMRNPVNKVITEINDYKSYAYMLGLALDDLDDRLKLKKIIRRAIVDSLFAMGIVKVGIASSDQMIEFGDQRIDPGQIYADNVDFDDFVIDPACRTLEEASFMGHRSRVPRQALLDNDNYDHDLVMQLPRSVSVDGHESRRASGLTTKNLSNQTMYEMEDYVDIVEVYLASTQRIITTPDPAQIMLDKYIGIQDYYGPAEGPYRFLSLSQPVPGNPFPVAPVGIWYDLHIMANRLMCKQMDRADGQKTLFIVDPANSDQGEDMREANDGEVVLGNPDSATVLSTPGAEAGTNDSLNNLQTWFNYMSGNPDQMAGVASQANTATQASILQGNSNVTVEDSRGMIYDFTADINGAMAWFLHYDPLIEIPLIARKRDWDAGTDIKPGEQLRLTPEQRRGEHFNFAFKIRPRSMTPVDPMVLSKRIIEFATNVVPSLAVTAQTCMQMGVPFNLQRAITSLAEQLELTEYVQDWFEDPEFLARIQYMMAMGPQAEGKASGGGGLSMPGVQQQGGYPGMTNAGQDGGVNQQAQQLAGVMQSATQGVR